MTDKEWETALKKVNENLKEYVDEEIYKIKYNIIKELIEKKND